MADFNGYQEKSVRRSTSITPHALIDRVADLIHGQWIFRTVLQRPSHPNHVFGLDCFITPRVLRVKRSKVKVTDNRVLVDSLQGE